jgi:multidrug efflux pump subunit AcrA (membrane-fusion protein)
VHILTKVFVLFAAVLSIMMAALAISYSVNADRVIDDYRDAMARADGAMSMLSGEKASNAQQKAALEDEKRALQDELASRDADTRRLEASNSELRIALRQAEAGRESISSKIAQLGVAVETQAKIIDEYKDRISKLTEEGLIFRNDRIDLERALSDLESQVIVYEQVKRALQEQLESLRTMVNAQQPGGNQTATSQTPVDVAGPAIHGAIDEVRTDPSSGNMLVQINLGTNDRIRENSRLYIHRDSTIYLGDIVVVSVDLNHSVGRIAYRVPGQTIRTGDQVLSKLGS